MTGVQTCALPILAAQMPEGEKIKAADYVIDNSGSLEQTCEQVKAVWERLHAGGG